MKKLLFICTLCCASILISAQTALTPAEKLVESITKDVTLSAEQVAQLTSAASQYVSAIQTANEQYSSNEEALVLAKAAACQTYTMQMRTILTEEQYQTLQQKQMERRNALFNQLKEGQQ